MKLATSDMDRREGRRVSVTRARSRPFHVPFRQRISPHAPTERNGSCVMTDMDLLVKYMHIIYVQWQARAKRYFSVLLSQTRRARGFTSLVDYLVLTFV